MIKNETFCDIFQILWRSIKAQEEIRKYFIICFAFASVAKVKFCQVYFNYLNFTKASSTSQLHTTAWNSKVRFYKRLFSLFNTSTQWLKITQKSLIFVKK